MAETNDKYCNERMFAHRASFNFSLLFIEAFQDGSRQTVFLSEASGRFPSSMTSGITEVCQRPEKASRNSNLVTVVSLSQLRISNSSLFSDEVPGRVPRAAFEFDVSDCGCK